MGFFLNVQNEMDDAAQEGRWPFRYLLCDKGTCLSRTHFLELPADLGKARAYCSPEAPSPTPANALACMSAHARLAESVPSPVAVYP